MNAPIKPKVRVTYPNISSVKRRLDFDSTNGTIHHEKDTGDEEVTSRLRSLSEGESKPRQTIKQKNELWEHIVGLKIKTDGTVRK